MIEQRNRLKSEGAVVAGQTPRAQATTGKKEAKASSAQQKLQQFKKETQENVTRLMYDDDMWTAFKGKLASITDEKATGQKVLQAGKPAPAEGQGA